jgi:hypothetical protein
MKNKIFCENCKGLRNHQELHKVERKGSDDNDYLRWFNKYSIMECNGCENISFLHTYGDTEMYHTNNPEGYQEYYYDETIYPYYLEKSFEIELKTYLPEKIRMIYSETLNALKANSYILTAGGLRATIEAICNHLKIRKDSLEERINLLHKKGHLTVSESKRLHSIRFLGNDALHEIEKPKKEHLYILLDIINHLLLNLFINDKKLAGKIETLIDNYDDFLKLIKNKLTKEMVGKEYTLIEILGKSKRLFPKGKITEFEKQFDEKIKEYSFLNKVKSKTENKYTIIEVPQLLRFGII